jgi:hypothetical protein
MGLFATPSAFSDPQRKLGKLVFVGLSRRIG